MKRLFFAAALAAVAITSPAFALTAVEVGGEVAGYHCGGSACTLDTPTTLTHYVGEPSRSEGMSAISANCRAGEVELAATPGHPGLCVMHPIQSFFVGGGMHAVHGAGCTTTTKVIGFDPTVVPISDGFSVTTSTSTRRGAC